MRLLRVVQITNSFSQVLARLTGVLIIILMMGVVSDSFLRGVFGVAVWGVLELSILILLGLIYLGLPATQADRVNFRVSVFTDRLPKRFDHAVAGLLLVLQLVVIGILCWFTWGSAIFSYKRQEVSMGMVEIPLWGHRTVIAFGLTLFWWQSLMAGVEFYVQGKHPYALNILADVKVAIDRQTL